ncbi:MAG TPA: CPBP family intramembrane glutamic endopeptidase [Candidatus Acidoferrales bacterium]|nr:CPBP family intramembrane glutamic endopeptidase [Candidatus Acidoferrales bacterium]
MNDDITVQQELPSLLQRIFVGKRGIRAGWSIGIFVVLLGLFTAAFFFPAKNLFEKNNLSLTDAMPLQSGAGELAALLGLLAASVVMALIERKPLISYGLEGTRRFARFCYGFVFGITALSVLVGVMTLCGFLSFDGQNIYGWQAVEFALGWVIVFLLVGLYEEYFLRGYIQATLTRGIGFWWSALLLSAAFGCLHLTNPGESPAGIFSAALVGMVFCISLWYLKNLWWAIGFHASWDWAESYLWGTPDSGRVVQGHLFSVHSQGNILWSGGATGPEGSLMVLPLLVIIALVMWIVWGRANKHDARSDSTAVSN